MGNFLEKIKRVKGTDLLSGFQFVAAVPYAIYLKRHRKNMWLICEDKNEARDNGYWLFQYVRREHEEQDIVYAINKKSVDYAKVKELGEVIQFGSVKHWAYYLAADINISSHKNGNPNAALCYFLEVYGLLKSTRVFLQHGIIENDLPFLHYKNTKFRLFMTSAPREYEFVRDTFGYPQGYVKCTGIARLDGLHDGKVKKNQILVMPTWRREISLTCSDKNQGEEFAKTEYYKHWMGLLTDEEVDGWLDAAGMEIVFYPHRNMQKFIKYFKLDRKHIKIADWEHYDIQQLLKESAFLITDYSSIFNDFAYMRKPMIYYQFDYDAFYRSQEYGAGYFSFEKDGFGPVCYEPEQLKQALKYAIDHNLENPKLYLDRQVQFFSLWDQENCKRNYEEIKKIKRRP